jgi:hypothetical protein
MLVPLMVIKRGQEFKLSITGIIQFNGKRSHGIFAPAD